MQDANGRYARPVQWEARELTKDTHLFYHSKEEINAIICNYVGEE